MASLERAIEIAARAHAGQVDKQGEPYILHPLRVMQDVTGMSARIVAVLHDVVEDTAVTLDEIRDQGFSEPILTALGLVTHQASDSYSEYVVHCRHHELARQVKLADLRDNASLSRVLMRPEKLDNDSARVQRYVLSFRYLMGDIDESSYRHAMRKYE